jgi:predicted nucleotidyltransferase
MAATVAAELWTREDVSAVILIGSVARGDATSSSDVDLAVVSGEEVEGPAMRRELRGGTLVEIISRSDRGWRERLRRPMPRWLYALLEGQILHDDGVGARLVDAAREARRAYKTPKAVLDEMAAAFWHGQAKVDRALASADPMTRAYQASLAVDWIIDALYAVHDVPLPAASRRLHYLEDVPLDTGMRRDWQSLLTGDVDERIHANARLQATIRARLPEPRLEVV